MLKTLNNVVLKCTEVEDFVMPIDLVMVQSTVIVDRPIRTIESDIERHNIDKAKPNFPTLKIERKFGSTSRILQTPTLGNSAQYLNTK